MCPGSPLPGQHAYSLFSCLRDGNNSRHSRIPTCHICPNSVHDRFSFGKSGKGFAMFRVLLVVDASLLPLPSTALDILYYGVTGIYVLWCHTSFASVTCKGIYTLAAYMVVVGPDLAFSRERNATIHLFISLHAKPALPLISRYVTHSARRALCGASSAIDPESLLSLSEASLKMTATKHPLINHAAFSRP